MLSDDINSLAAQALKLEAEAKHLAPTMRLLSAELTSMAERARALEGTLVPFAARLDAAALPDNVVAIPVIR